MRTDRQQLGGIMAATVANDVCTIFHVTLGVITYDMSGWCPTEMAVSWTGICLRQREEGGVWKAFPLMREHNNLMQRNMSTTRTLYI